MVHGALVAGLGWLARRPAAAFAPADSEPRGPFEVDLRERAGSESPPEATPLASTRAPGRRRALPRQPGSAEPAPAPPSSGAPRAEPGGPEASAVARPGLRLTLDEPGASGGVFLGAPSDRPEAAAPPQRGAHGVGPRIPGAPPPLRLGDVVDPEPIVDHRRFTVREHDGQIRMDERPRVETPRERQRYIQRTSQNRVHTAIDESSHGMPWLWGGEPTLTGEGDQLEYQAKKQALASTFEERLRAAGAARAEVQQIALAGLATRLEAIWRQRDRSAAARRRLLFELWEECDARAAAGRAARTRIEAFIQKRLPPESPDAYGPAELDALNAGRVERFAPYAERFAP